MFEKFLHQTPFFRLVLPLILGILLQNSFDLDYIPSLILLFSFFVLVLLMELFKLTQRYTINKLWGILVSLLMFFYGIHLVKHKQSAEPDFVNSKNTFIATIIEQPEEKENSVKTILRVQYFKDSVSWTKSNAKIITYFQKDTNRACLRLGDQIIATSFLNTIKNCQNPYAFNYKQYLKYKEIYYDTYITATNFKVTAQNKGSRINILSNNARQKLLGIYKKHNISENEYGVLTALTLGYKNALTPELKESYSTSGVMHVLAVSGLHVGILFIILCKLLFFLERNKYGKIIQSILIILILFIYAFLTGLSNSVIRATIMFTFISVGRMFTRQLNIYNTIFASAFIMLLYNPYFIMEVSFQLSYLAVISIVFFQPKIYSLLQFNQSIPDYIWQLISVSIAAQIGTFPITVYYFDQFPIYFIISNIIVIPFVTILIYGAIILFVFSFSDVISLFISKILRFITLILNKMVCLVEQLPYSKVDNFNLGKFEVAFLLLFLIFSSFFIISKRLYLFKISLSILIIILTFNLYSAYNRSQQSLLVVHNIKSLSAINLIKGNRCNFICNKKITKTENDFKYNISPLLKKHGVKEFNEVYTANKDSTFRCYAVKNKRIVHLNCSSLLNYKPIDKLKVNYIVLSEDVNIKIKDLTLYFEFEKIIFDSSNTYYKVKEWVKECSGSGVNFFNVLDEGAFVKYL